LRGSHARVCASTPTRRAIRHAADGGVAGVAGGLRKRPSVNRIGVSFWRRCACWWPTVLTIVLGVIAFRAWRVWREASAVLREGA